MERLFAREDAQGGGVMPNRSQYSGRTIHGIIPIMQRNRRFHGN